MKLLEIYLVCVNLLGLVLMFSDKQRAIRRHWRIPERVLFLTAILGGSLGSLLGMWLFRHKTKHWYFVLGMPLILIVQSVAALILI